MSQVRPQSKVHRTHSVHPADVVADVVGVAEMKGDRLVGVSRSQLDKTRPARNWQAMMIWPMSMI